MNDKELENVLEAQPQNVEAQSEQNQETSQVQVSESLSESAETPRAAAVEPQTAPVESSKERNLRILRERAERLERENEELRRSIPRQNEQKVESPDEDFDLGVRDDELVEGKHFGKVAQEIKNIRRELREAKESLAQSRNMSIETKLKSSNPDFDKVVTKENMNILAELDPEMYEVIQASPNLYAKAKTAYNQIKKYGIYTEDNYSIDKETVQKNSTKPRPSASISPQQGATPLSRANEFAGGSLTEDMRQKIWEETVRCAQSR